MEMGVGIHGEPGRRRTKLKGADDIVREILDAICGDLSLSDDGVLLFVNGFGGTPLSELYLVYETARRMLQERKIEVERSLVGSFVTSLDMAGCSITLTRLDEPTTLLWDAPVRTPALRWGADD